MEHKHNISEVLVQRWGVHSESILCFEAPARINIIGEHVDYLGGLVVPAAIDFFVRIAIRKNNSNQIRLYSLDWNREFVSLYAKDLNPSTEETWSNYLVGVVDQLHKKGFTLSGFDAVLTGTIPQGAGLSSSAAVEVAMGYALDSMYQLGLNRTEIALVGQKAENEFVGTKCGIMDQFVIANGKKDHCLELNTETLEYKTHQFQLGDSEFYLINTHVKHSLVDGEYNKRREQCRTALEKLKKLFPNLENLYQWEPPVSVNELDGYLQSKGLDATESKRVIHVVGEKARTKQVLQGFSSNDLSSVGKAIYGSHDSLSQYFEVSCIESDFLVNELQKLGAIGARQIGGGFGGCILVLDKKDRYAKIKETLEQAFQSRFGVSLDFYRFSITEGVLQCPTSI